MPGDGSPALAQKADNVELYKQLIDLSSQALDMQTEIAKLREENIPSEFLSFLKTFKKRRYIVI